MLLLPVLAALAIVSAAYASEQLREVEGLPFTLAVHPWLEPRMAAMSDQAAFELATVLPASTVEIDILELNWPKTSRACWLAVAQSAPRGASLGSELVEHLAVMVAEGDPELVVLPGQGAAARLNRVCIWPTAKSADADLVILCSLGATEQDAWVEGFVITSDGVREPLETGSALTLYGWFEAQDLDSDGSYELITSRNLDGTWGGFFYHAVRAYDAETASYVARPGDYQDYFAQEQQWLDWVIEMRPLIQANPAEYLNESGIGYAYVAEYNGRRYGFDSIVEVPLTFTGVGDVEEFNRGRRAAFALVRDYRDELAAWLDGGDYPATWKLDR